MVVCLFCFVLFKFCVVVVFILFCFCFVFFSSTHLGLTKSKYFDTNSQSFSFIHTFVAKIRRLVSFNICQITSSLNLPLCLQCRYLRFTKANKSTMYLDHSFIALHQVLTLTYRSNSSVVYKVIANLCYTLNFRKSSTPVTCLLNFVHCTSIQQWS